MMIASCTIWIAQDYPLQCKPCFHIKTHLNTCFDHICCEFTNWRTCGDQYMVSIIKCVWVRNYMHLLQFDEHVTIALRQRGLHVFSFFLCFSRSRLPFERFKSKISTIVILLFIFRTDHDMRCALQVHAAANFTFISLQFNSLLSDAVRFCIVFWLSPLLTILSMHFLCFTFFPLCKRFLNKYEKKNFILLPYSFSLHVLFGMHKRQPTNRMNGSDCMHNCVLHMKCRCYAFVCCMNSGCNVNIYRNKCTYPVVRVRSRVHMLRRISLLFVVVLVVAVSGRMHFIN